MTDFIKDSILQGLKMKTKRVRNRSNVDIGKPCKHCGGPISAPSDSINYWRKTRIFCGVKCIALWLEEHPDQDKARLEKLTGRKSKMPIREVTALIERTKADPRLAANESNINAKTWRLRSPMNVIHQFKNLSFFIRNNVELFSPEDVKWTKNKRGKWYCRAMAGIAGICMRYKNPNGSWKGWTWYSQTERLKNEGNDLLDRELAK